MSKAIVKKVFELGLDDDPKKLLTDQDWLVYQVDKMVVGNYKTYKEALVALKEFKQGEINYLDISS